MAGRKSARFRSKSTPRSGLLGPAARSISRFSIIICFAPALRSPPLPPLLEYQVSANLFGEWSLEYSTALRSTSLPACAAGREACATRLIILQIKWEWRAWQRAWEKFPGSKEKNPFYPSALSSFQDKKRTRIKRVGRIKTGKANSFAPIGDYRNYLSDAQVTTKPLAF